MATLAKLLQADMGLPDMAKRLAAAGRGKDSILAHINPKEASLLKARGGSGAINPNTGIMEFDESGEGDAYQYKPEDYSNAPSFAQHETPAAPADTGGFVQAPGEAGRGAATTPTPTAAPSFGAASGQLPSVGAPSEATAADYSKQMGAGGGFIDTLKKFGGGLNDINQALQPAVPLAKALTGVYGAVQGNKAAKQMQQQAAANEAEVRSLAAPYKQQGQQLIDLGQAGKLTAPQQKQLEVQRAVAAQQMAASGVSGGTAQQQLDANLQQQASAFAQQNIDQGMKLMGIADDYIMKALSTGYAQNKDAQALAQDFYKSIAQFLEPEAKTSTPQQANAAPK
jgi:hypothetical protein